MLKIFISILIVLSGLGIWGFFIEPGMLRERHESVAAWPGPKLKIAFFSDLHAGAPHINEKYIRDLIRRINEHNPDIILIGGDLVINGVVGGEHFPIEKLAPFLKDLKARLGVFAVLGNHDWWNDGPKIQNILQENGIVVLENESRFIKTDSDFGFWLVGIGDDFTKHADAPKAISQITADGPRILFMHDPAAIFQMNSPFFLALAGHMHGGQIFIPGIGALVTPGAAPKSWAQGWIEFELGSIFISKGVGTSILPIRINSVPEYVVLELSQ